MQRWDRWSEKEQAAIDKLNRGEVISCERCHLPTRRPSSYRGQIICQTCVNRIEREKATNAE